MEDLVKAIKSIPSEEYSGVIKYGKRAAKWAVQESFSDIKIAVLGSGSIQFLVLALRAMLLKYDIKADIYEGEYAGLNMDLLDETSPFYQFNPKVVFLLPDYRDIQYFPELMADEKEVSDWSRSQVDIYVNYWTLIEKKLPDCHIFQSNFVLPVERELGNLEENLIFSRQTCYKMLNLELLRHRKKNVTIMDMEYVASYIGKKNWFDQTAWMLHKASFAMEYVGIVGELLAKQTAVFLGKTRKCLVLDLDNTLWGGVVGDDGCDGINLNPNDAVGEAYLTFQKYVLRLRNRGVILAVCSKNEMEIAKEPFLKNPNMLIQLSDIAVFVANWEDKAGNLKRIAEELNIGLDSMVFFDDNPAEREIVKMYAPEVWVVDVPEDPADYVRALNEESPFEWMQLTKEDRKRADTYEQNKKRKEMLNDFKDYDEYLKALCMKGNAGALEEKDSERFTQLINKSNQFNLRTKRYSEGQITEVINNPDAVCLKVELEDKFSNYGLISCIILKKEDETCFIDTWVMSCRVLKRGVEELAFKQILKTAREWGCKVIIGEYIPTKKNKMVETLYQQFGFEARKDLSSEEQAVYQYDVSKEYNKDIYIEVKGEV